MSWTACETETQLHVKSAEACTRDMSAEVTQEDSLLERFTQDVAAVLAGCRC